MAKKTGEKPREDVLMEVKGRHSFKEGEINYVKCCWEVKQSKDYKVYVLFPQCRLYYIHFVLYVEIVTSFLFA